MRRNILYLASAAIVFLTGFMFTSFQDQRTVDPQTPKTPVSLPVSLDKLYPPKAEQSIFLFKMLGMASPFTGIVVDLFESDLENAWLNYEEFKKHYIEISKLVPEWEGHYPLEPIISLGAALETGDPGKVMTVVEEIGKICSDCHVSSMPGVQHKYHWGNFSTITVTDPLTRQEVNFQQLMLFTDASFTGIGVDIEQRQVKNAQRQLEGFKARFEALKGTCMNCHDTERYYYVDEGAQKLIEKLEEALNMPSVDSGLVRTLTQNIGMESCFKCHLVHVPAAAAQLQRAK